MSTHISRSLITALALFFLVACDQTRVEEHFTNLPGTSNLPETQDFTNQTNASLLIVGLRSNQPLQSSTISATWQQFDPNLQKLVENGADITVSINSSDQDPRDPLATQYFVLSIRPGFYILENAKTTFRPTGFSVLNSSTLLFPSSVINIKNQRYDHTFYERLYVPFGKGRVELNKENLISELISSSLSHRFFVNPGDIVYIGDFVIGRNAPWILKIDHNIPAVTALLKEKYPNVKGRVLFRNSSVPTNISCDFDANRKQGLESLRNLVINRQMTQNNLSSIGCSSGTLAVKKDETIIIQDDTVLEFGLPRLP
jgi:hypothetical protein